jgi:NTP pyrophosphatase (non-canonical NTP hydrolase)
MTELAAALSRFAEARDWGQFHTPKNLSMALAVEVAELMEIFQWRGDAESSHLDPGQLERVREEIGDVQIYLTRLASRLGIDPLEAAWRKLEQNEQKYPVAKARGNARKYTELEAGD